MWREICLLLIMVGFSLSKLTGDHVCATEKQYTVNVTESFIRNVTVRKYQWCLNVPPRCSFYTSKEVNDTRIVEKNETRIIEICCPGFKEDTVNKICVLNCTDCVHGLCNMGKCVCLAGFTGDACDTKCQPTQWGINCKYQCICERGNCDARTGNCICPPGWNGSRCDKSCPRGHYGINCTKECQCQFNEICDSINGTCSQVSTISKTTESSTKEYGYTKDSKNNRFTVDLGTTRFRSNSDPEFRKNPTLLKYHTFSLTTTPITTHTKQIETTTYYHVGTKFEDKISKSAFTKVPFTKLMLNNHSSTTLRSIARENIKKLELTTNSYHLEHALKPTTSSTSNFFKNKTTFEMSFTNNGKFNHSEKKSENDVGLKVLPQDEIISNSNSSNSNNIKLNPQSETEHNVIIHKTDENNEDKSVEEIVKSSKEQLKNILNKHSSETTDEEVYLKNQEVYGKKNNLIEENDELLLNSISISVSIAIAIVIIAIITLTFNRYRKKKNENKAEGQQRPKTSTVSVYTHSIFHTPLPEPPKFESTFCDAEQAAENRTFETRVVCSMNFPTNPNFKDPREYLYDHPPSTGSYRAASIPEPPEIEMRTNSIVSLKQIEPVYDEIPSRNGNVALLSPQTQPYNSASSLYINTCGKTRL